MSWVFYKQNSITVFLVRIVSSLQLNSTQENLWVICKSCFFLYKELDHPWILVSEREFWNQYPYKYQGLCRCLIDLVRQMCPHFTKSQLLPGE